jgi:hypothetical protein
MAIFDATNTTDERRAYVAQGVSGKPAAFGNRNLGFDISARFLAAFHHICRYANCAGAVPYP